MHVTTSTLDVPGARLHHEVRGTGPLVVLIGAPMDADAFAPLADLLAVDHTVLTADPRGIKRSSVDDPDCESTPEVRADDLARLISSIDAGPAIVLGSSGGAVTALALAQSRPELVRTVIAHEPPLIDLLDDREQLRAETEKQASTYLDGDVLGAWRLMLGQANIVLPDEVMEQMFGGDRDPQAVADERFWFANEMRPSTFWQPDLAVLGSSPVRLVIGIGDDSAGQLCDRTSQALATALGTDPVRFPGDHTGFVDDPAGFEARMREVLGS